MGRAHMRSGLLVCGVLVGGLLSVSSGGLAAVPRAAAAAGPAVVHVATYEVVVAVPLLNLRRAPSLHAPVLLRLPQGTTLDVHGYTAHWLQVTARAGQAGYVFMSDVRLPGGRLTPLHPVATPRPQATVLIVAVRAANLRAAPRLTAPVRAVLPASTRVTVRATEGSWAEVTTATGVTGWLWSPLTRSA